MRLVATDKNCLQACLASIFEVPLHDPPDFEEGWTGALSEWLSRRRLVADWVCSEVPRECWEQHGQSASDGSSATGGTSHWYDPDLLRGYTVGLVSWPDGGDHHAVVCLDGAMVWDPSGLPEISKGEICGWLVFREARGEAA